MTEADYRKMKSEIEAEHHADVEAAKKRREEALAHIEFVWQRFNGGLFKATAPAATHKANGTPQDRGSLILGMKEAIRALDVFSVDDLIAYLGRHQPELDAASREVSITSNVSRLNAAGEVEVVEKGARGKRQTYKKTAKFDIATGVTRKLKKVEAK